MFTGIIEALGSIDSLDRRESGGRMRVRLEASAEIARGLRPGSSIAVNGCCLTVTECSAGGFAADLSEETLRRTSFEAAQPGMRVNLERPLIAGKEFGGHFVQGHVDGMGRVERLVPEGDTWWLSVRVPAELGRYIAEKGSLAVDGISLTVAAWRDNVADFAVIPFTYDHTNIAALAVGDPVNLECDILAKYVERLLAVERQPAASRLTLARLIEEGF